MRRGATRRELLRNAAAAGVLASSLARPGLAQAATSPTESDAAVLAHTFEVEKLVAGAYVFALGSDRLRPRVRTQLQGMLSQELKHISALRGALRALDTPVPRVRAASAQAKLTANHIHVNLAQIPSQHTALKLLIDVESLAEGAYFSAISKLSDPSLLRTCTEVMGCEAQHWTLLSALQHHGDVTRSVPYPFVQGSPEPSG